MVINSIDFDQLVFKYSLSKPYLVSSDTYKDDRRLKEQKLISMLCSNTNANCIEIGTYKGQTAYNMSCNTDKTVYTVNPLPCQMGGGILITDTLDRDDIGAFYKHRSDRGRIVQIYENSLNWCPENIENVKVILIDGCHDSDYVFNDAFKMYNLLDTGGFLLFHDFVLNPLRSWNKSVYKGIEKFCKVIGIENIYHITDTFMGLIIK